MPMPMPEPDEDHEDFVDRCMANPMMNGEYPDAAQREAVCETQWEDNMATESGKSPSLSPESRVVLHNDGPPQWLRVSAGGRPIGVDRQANVIRGGVIAQSGEFKTQGRGEFDHKSLKQILRLMKAEPVGLKSRFAHPTLSGDGIGKHLGRWKDPYLDKIIKAGPDGQPQEIEAVRADLHFDKTAMETPVGGGRPLGDYLMALAESDSDALSSSLALTVDEEYRLDSKGRPKVGPDGKELPPLWHPTVLHASDLVGEGEAVDGLLSTQLSTDGLPDAVVRRGCELLDQQFPNLSREVIRSKCTIWLNLYLTHRFGEEPEVPVGQGYDPALDPERIRHRMKAKARQ